MITPALQTPAEIRTAAQLLTTSADAYNTRLKAQAPHLTSGEVFARLGEEQRLRSIANQLYFEASKRTLSAAVDDQSALEATLASAGTAFAHIAHFEGVLELAADLLVLGGAIVSGKVPTIVAALAEVRKDILTASPSAPAG